METSGWLIIIVVASGAISAFVGTFNPRAGSFLWRIVHVLNYLSMVNPRDVKTVNLKEYEEFLEWKQRQNDNETT